MQQRISCPTKNQEVKNDSAEDLALHWMEDEKTEEKKQNGKGNGWIV